MSAVETGSTKRQQTIKNISHLITKNRGNSVFYLLVGF